MDILVTGAKGFVGRNLCEQLKTMEGVIVHEIDVDSAPGELENYAAGCDIVYHLAGVNRPKDT